MLISQKGEWIPECTKKEFPCNKKIDKSLLLCSSMHSIIYSITIVNINYLYKTVKQNVKWYPPFSTILTNIPHPFGIQTSVKCTSVTAAVLSKCTPDFYMVHNPI